MGQSSPHNTRVINNFHLRKRLKFAKSNRLVSAVKFIRHTLTESLTEAKGKEKTFLTGWFELIGMVAKLEMEMKAGMNVLDARRYVASIPLINHA